jgi:hypothetical protein
MTNWFQLRQQVIARDRYECQTCFEPATEVHHVIPKRLNGLDSLNNLTSVCQPCHSLLELRHKISGKMATFYMDENIYWYLKQLAIEKRTNVTALLDEALKEYLAKQRTAYAYFYFVYG